MILFGAVRQGFSAPVTPGVEDLTGRAPRTLAEYARDHAAKWRAGEAQQRGQ